MSFKLWSIVLLAGAALLILLRPQPEVIRTDAVTRQPEQTSARPAPAHDYAARPPQPAQQLPQDMQAAIRNVADAYQQDSQYPPYSIPLSEAHSELLYPDAATASTRDLTIYGLPGSLSVSLSAYRYRPGDIIEADVHLRGDHTLFTQVARVSLSLRDKDNQLLQPLSAASTTTSAEEWLYHARVGAQKDWPTELNLTAEVFLTNGESLKQSAPFQLFVPVAEITGLGNSSRHDNELIIPVQIKNAQPGFYKLGAALLYADHKPIAYVQGKGRISGSSGTLELKVWGALLAQMPDKARLELGSFQLRRIPEKPGPAVGFGSSKQAFYTVGDINPADYSDLPYRNEQALQRLQFLQSLGQPSGGTGI